MIITLTTDFGLKDPFVGTMKGVILGIAPAVQIVDITHEIPAYDVLEASLVVHAACRYFPAGTIHIVVVDPGVGSARRPIAMASQVRGTEQIFIGPDNGALLPVSGPIPTPVPAFHVTNAKLFCHPVSQTFHGRDVFAPVAAHLANGTAIESLGPQVTDLIQPQTFSRPTVLRVDRFGNLLTNLRRDQLGSGFVIRTGGVEIRRLVTNYVDGRPGEIFAIEGSAGLIEICQNQGSAADRLNLRRGAEFEVETGTPNH